MASKDYFSGHANIYATFRPTYPDALYDFIFKHLKHTDVAWDCGTGNGQVAEVLAQHFKKVLATDISKQQIEKAAANPVIEYSVRAAEKTNFPDHTFDLITVGQAFHWFQPETFYGEVKRVLKPEGLLALWGYSLCTVNPEVDELFLDFYWKKIGPYWDSARRLVEDEYKNIQFPFVEIPSPKFHITVSWNLAHFTGYLESWSATQKFIRENGFNPVSQFAEDLKKVWKEGQIYEVRFPVFLMLGKMGT